MAARNGHLVLGDIRDATSVTEAAAHVDGIIHLAGVLGT
jgi:UDP-glucose 4-epimerase